MFTKPVKSKPHKQLEILKKRTALSVKQQNSLDRMSSGYDGELHLSQQLQKVLQCNPIKIFNLHLKISDSECQIDCLLIFQNECILIEVKNYQGDFFIQNDDWYMLSKEGIKNPLYQLQRTELLLKRFFKQKQIPLNIRSFVVFTHPEFQLYQAPLNIPVIFPTQLRRFTHKLQNIPCHLSKQHHDTAELLKSKHLQSSAYESPILYDYDQLRKGITCEKCHGFMEVSGRDNISCTECNNTVRLDRAVIGNTRDFHTLFPNRRITVQAIAEWTGHLISKHNIRKTLSIYCSPTGRGRNTHYILNRDTPRL